MGGGGARWEKVHMYQATNFTVSGLWKNGKKCSHYQEFTFHGDQKEESSSHFS